LVVERGPQRLRRRLNIRIRFAAVATCARSGGGVPGAACTAAPRHGEPRSGPRQQLVEVLRWSLSHGWGDDLAGAVSFPGSGAASAIGGPLVLHPDHRSRPGAGPEHLGTGSSTVSRGAAGSATADVASRRGVVADDPEQPVSRTRGSGHGRMVMSRPPADTAVRRRSRTANRG
jgi:hypothetical protein